VAELSASPAAAAARLDVEVSAQTLAPATPVRRLVHLEAEARFDAAARRTTVTLARTRAADDAAALEARLELPDAGAPRVRHAAGRSMSGACWRWCGGAAAGDRRAPRASTIASMSS